MKESKEQAAKYKTKTKEYKELYEQALNRELMLIERVNELEKELKKPRLTMNNNRN